MRSRRSGDGNAGGVRGMINDAADGEDRYHPFTKDEVDGGKKSMTIVVEEEKRVLVVDPFKLEKVPFWVLLETNKKKSEWREDRV
ncbi:hypothetical protein ACLOJK_031199 [Asimina triloba]